MGYSTNTIWKKNRLKKGGYFEFSPEFHRTLNQIIFKKKDQYCDLRGDS